MENWDEVRTALHVARHGTVSGAADTLGVHHATVIRHVDALEQRLGVKLFQRHARGYTPTEAGLELMRVAQVTDDQFSQLQGRIRGRGEALSGDLVVTSVPSMAFWLAPLLADFQIANPDVRIRFLTDTRLFRLEYGEAHVAVRAGNPPDQPDNVVQPFVTFEVGLYASRAYIERHGLPASEEEALTHRFVTIDREKGASRAPAAQWLDRMVDPQRVVFRATEEVLRDAVVQGVGLGFVSRAEAEDQPDLVQVLAPREEWQVQLWLVTHVDLHRTPKVQAVLAHLKSAARVPDKA